MPIPAPGGHLHLRHDPALLLRDAPRMRAVRPGVAVRELPGIGHAPALMSYDQIAAARDFLLR